MDGQDGRIEAILPRSLLRGLWWLPWLCVVQVAYAIPRKLVNWVGEATTGRGVKYS